jgi:hypothetical protein
MINLAIRFFSPNNAELIRRIYGYRPVEGDLNSQDRALWQFYQSHRNILKEILLSATEDDIYKTPQKIVTKLKSSGIKKNDIFLRADFINSYYNAICESGNEEAERFALRKGIIFSNADAMYDSEQKNIYRGYFMI